MGGPRTEADACSVSFAVANLKAPANTGQRHRVRERGFRVLVCGGRNYGATTAEAAFLFDKLAEINDRTPIAYVVHGNARGADRLAGVWANRYRDTVSEIACPADWARHGLRAGPIRNQNMLGHLTLGNAVVLAFPGGAGTRDMVKRARKAGFDVIECAP